MINYSQPTNISGVLTGIKASVQGTTASNVYVTLLSVASHGTIYNIVIQKITMGNGLIRLTVDGIVFNEITVASGVALILAFDKFPHTSDILMTVADTTVIQLMLEYKSSLLVEYKSSDASNFRAKVHYSQG